MATDEEMQRSLEFNQGRVAQYKAIADAGGEGRMSAADAEAEVGRFQRFADRIANRIAERATEERS